MYDLIRDGRFPMFILLALGTWALVVAALAWRRPDRHALLELEAILDQIRVLRDEGDAERFITDNRYRWVLHRLWIAAGNEAFAISQSSAENGP